MKRSWLAYGLFFLFLVAVSLVARFPAADLARILEAETARRTGGRVSLAVGDSGYGWPFALVCRRVTVFVAGRPVTTIERLRCALASPAPVVHASADLLGGSLEALIDVRRGKIDASWRGIDCGRLSDRIGGKSDGRLSLTVAGQGNPADGTLVVTVIGGRLRPKGTVLADIELDVGDVTVRAHLVGNELRLEEARWQGRSVSGRIEGTVATVWPLADSILRLHGRLTVHPELFAALQRADAVPVGAGDRLDFRLTGTVADWQVRLGGGS